MTTEVPSNQHQKGFLFPSAPLKLACKSQRFTLVAMSKM